LLQLFDESGRYVRTIRFAVQLGDRPKRYPNSEFLGLTGIHDTLPRSLNETWWESYTFVRLNAHGDSIGAIGPLRAMEYMATEWEGSQLRAQRPLGRAAAFAIGPGAFYYGDSDSYRILAFDQSGLLKFVVERTAQPHPVTAEVQAAYVRERLEGADNPQLRAAYERYFANVPFPETAPAYRRFDVDSEGNLWVDNWTLPGATGRTWSVFSPSGRWITDVSGPQGEPLEIGDEYMILLQRSEMGTEQVNVYRLAKSSTT
jgi:hypothetical protein